MRVGIGASSFAQEDQAPLILLEQAGMTVVQNPFGRRMTESEITTYLQTERIDGLLAGLEPITRRVLQANRGRLKAVARIGVGVTNVDVDACRQLGIKFSFTPDAPTSAVTEMTLAALLCLARDLEPMNRALHEGAWQKSIGRSLRELTVLVIGYGRIGQAVARQLSELGSRVLVSDPVTPSADCPFPVVTLHEGLALADVVTIHASGETTILGDLEFSLVKRGVILMNPARAGLVAETALMRALDAGVVSKAWLDVFSEEPYAGPLRAYAQILMTPHVATYTRRCRLDMETQAVTNLLRDLGFNG